jgi:hypothetical protein
MRIGRWSRDGEVLGIHSARRLELEADGWGSPSLAERALNGAWDNSGLSCRADHGHTLHRGGADPSCQIARSDTLTCAASALWSPTAAISIANATIGMIHRTGRVEIHDSWQCSAWTSSYTGPRARSNLPAGPVRVKGLRPVSKG